MKNIAFTLELIIFGSTYEIWSQDLGLDSIKNSEDKVYCIDYAGDD